MHNVYHFGADYYPEHWPEERWEIDARLMAEAGFTVVRLAEFAWSRLEPVEGRLDFTWLDRALATLAAHGIQAILGTPTASPPPWLMKGHPEAYRVREDGHPLTYGNRREYCPNSLVYQAYSQQIVQAMAEHYAGHPAVIGWQIDNEFGDRCYCPNCAAAFQNWLSQRYDTLDRLNERWGTIFWSHVYSAWDEIPVPLSTGGSPNPGLALDFARFSSDSYVSYQRQQIEILRRVCPTHFITHNLMGFGYDRINYFDLAADLDFIAWDNYPRTQWNFKTEPEILWQVLGHDTMRGLKRQNFWMMEQQGGQGGWEVLGVPPRPGELRLWAYQAIAHGADAMIFFRWRTARFGTEQYWHGLLDHDGTPGRRYQELKRMGLELRRIGDQILGAQVKAKTALLLSYDSRFAFQIQPNNPDFSYGVHFRDWYQALHDQQHVVDVVATTTDLSGYKLVIAPALHVVTPAEADHLKGYVESGGVLVLTQRSGVKDEANQVVNQRLPGLLAELCGVVVEEYDSLGPEMHNQVAFTLPALVGKPPATVGVLCDILQPKGAEIAAVYTQDYYAGKPAITIHSVGQGKVIYVGAVGGGDLYATLIAWLANLAGAEPIAGAVVPTGVELAERWQGDRRLLFVLNHTTHTQPVILTEPVTDLLNGQVLHGTVSLPGREVLICGL